MKLHSCRITDLVGGTYIVLTHIPLTGLQRLLLTFKISSHDPRRYWKEFFLPMTELKTLVIWRAESAWHILEFLTLPISHYFETLSTISSSEQHEKPRSLLSQLQEVVLDERTLYIISDPSSMYKLECQKFLVALRAFFAFTSSNQRRGDAAGG